MENKKVIIIDASSGIGRALAHKFSKNGYDVGLVSRRVHLLNEISEELDTNCYVKQIDVTEEESAMKKMETLLKEMVDIDIIILNAGAGRRNHEVKWEEEKITAETNVMGFTAMINKAFHYFKDRGRGHIVGVSSIAGLWGNRYGPAYSASKSYVSKYLDGIRNKSIHDGLNIDVTDIIPGFVDTKMAQGKHIFWKASVKKASDQIYKAIIKKKRKAFITKRWKLIAFLIKIIPDFILDRL